VEADLNDLEEVLGVVETNRSRFPHLDDAEVAGRRTFVLASRRATLSIRDDLAAHAPKSARIAPPKSAEREGLLANEGGGLSSPAALCGGAAASPCGSGRSCSGCGSTGGGGMGELTPACEEPAPGSNAHYLESGMAMQAQQYEMQEEALDQLSAGISRLKSLGSDMNDELKTQKRMLDHLEEQVDGAADAMASLKAKMKVMANSKDRGKFCAICALSLMLFGLTCLVLYT
jgi:hypothetical protein